MSSVLSGFTRDLIFPVLLSPPNFSPQTVFAITPLLSYTYFIPNLRHSRLQPLDAGAPAVTNFIAPKLVALLI